MVMRSSPPSSATEASSSSVKLSLTKVYFAQSSVWATFDSIVWVRVKLGVEDGVGDGVRARG